MANSYNSAFTGEHNDEYDSRINALEQSGLTFRGANPTTLTNDTMLYWRDTLLPGFYWYSVLDSVHGQPSQWGFLINFKFPGTSEIMQLWLDAGSKNTIYCRGANGATTDMPAFFPIGGGQKSYGFYKSSASAFNVTSTQVRYGTITVTTHGRPVFIICSGDFNPTAETAWMNMYILRNGTTITHDIVESHGSSWNIPFCISYLDNVAAGTYSYSIDFKMGSNTANLSEGGAIQSPDFSVFEI